MKARRTEFDTPTQRRSGKAARDDMRKYPEEAQARKLHRALAKETARRGMVVTLSIEGAGVHWHCAVALGVRICQIHCFAEQRVEHFIEFDEGGTTAAMGRTPLSDHAIDAALAWLAGSSVENLHRQFAFVDARFRALRAILREVRDLRPATALAVSELKKDLADIYELWYRARDRACRVAFYGDNPEPDLYFLWDECEMFRLRTGDAQLRAALIDAWIVDGAVPSRIKAEYEVVTLQPVARYYEEGRPIEGEFICSWDSVEAFYHHSWPRDYPGREDVLRLIAEMRRAGFDRTLRAGQSLFTLMVSRSRRHGLRRDQHWIAMSVGRGGMEVEAQLGGKEELRSEDVALIPDLERLLRQLEAEPIC